ncbi:hypothetical protein LR48_Vigan406s007100 [Vigna angularis]|uniref:Uncharacterized protein n=1 Tax=Phaseolus angularis TaxID=3914 RepID=A0A0L9TA34_PHAAN|nr:hypothetical protein LR48_Vigan406s007100 [Vigna angularis]
MLPQPKKKQTSLIVGVSVSVVAIVLLAIAIGIYFYRKMRNADVIEAWELEIGPHRSFPNFSGQRRPQLRRCLPPFRRPRTPSRLLHLLRQPRPPCLEASRESHGRHNRPSLARPLPPLHSRPPPPPPPPRRLRPLHRPPQPPRLLPLVQEWIYEGCTEIRDFDNAGG